MWTNLEQIQREILTTERQSRFVTGGGSETPCTQLDPDVAMIAPNLMTTAPVLFTSNLDDDEAEGICSRINTQVESDI